MVDRAISDAILKAVKGHFHHGDSFRMRHKACTPPEKDPCMVVTKQTGGYMWHCHRCHTSGWVNDNLATPAQVSKIRKAMDDRAVETLQKKLIDLPFDFQRFVVDADEKHRGSLPFYALNHLLKYNITEHCMSLFNIGWSKTWGRIIFPLYEYAEMNGQTARKLVGWVGRDPKWTDESKYPKWQTRAERGTRRYFVCPGIEKEVVLVEDAISAIKVWQATGYTVIALLTTTVSNDLLRKLRGKKIHLWLDGDQLAHSVKTVMRMRELGLDAKRIHTTKDPKCYNELAIRVNLKAPEHELSEATKAAMGLSVDPNVWEDRPPPRHLTDPYYDREETPDYAG